MTAWLLDLLMYLIAALVCVCKAMFGPRDDGEGWYYPDDVCRPVWGCWRTGNGAWVSMSNVTYLTMWRLSRRCRARLLATYPPTRHSIEASGRDWATGAVRAAPRSS